MKLFKITSHFSIGGREEVDNNGELCFYFGNERETRIYFRGEYRRYEAAPFFYTKGSHYSANGEGCFADHLERMSSAFKEFPCFMCSEDGNRAEKVCLNYFKNGESAEFRIDFGCGDFCVFQVKCLYSGIVEQLPTEFCFSLEMSNRELCGVLED